MRHGAAEIGNRPNQRLGIGMMRNRHQLLARRGFHRLPAVHDVNFVRPFTEHLHIVTDQQNRGVVVLVQPRQQADDLRLCCRLHGVSRFIGDQQPRLVSQCDGDHDLLTLAIRQLVGEAAHRIFMVFNPHAVQELNGAPLAPAKTLPPAAFKGPAGDILRELFADTFGRIETGLRLLKNHRDVVAHQFTPFAH